MVTPKKYVDKKITRIPQAKKYMFSAKKISKTQKNTHFRSCVNTNLKKTRRIPPFSSPKYPQKWFNSFRMQG